MGGAHRLPWPGPTHRALLGFADSRSPRAFGHTRIRAGQLRPSHAQPPPTRLPAKHAEEALAFTDCRQRLGPTAREQLEEALLQRFFSGPWRVAWEERRPQEGTLTFLNLIPPSQTLPPLQNHPAEAGPGEEGRWAGVGRGPAGLKDWKARGRALNARAPRERS